MADRFWMHRTQFTETYVQGLCPARHVDTAREGYSVGTHPSQRCGSPTTRFPVIALSFLVFRSLPQGLLKVPQWGLSCGLEHGKIPLVPAELPQRGLARTQPQVKRPPLRAVVESA